MIMITEDYCSFEVAKLLKEKGFDYKGFDYIDFEGEVIRQDRPTHQMAMKWLREKGFHINAPISYDYSVDADGNVISTKRVLNLDEKERILRFLESKNVPFNEFTLNEAFRLFAYGLLDIDEPTQELSR